MRTFTWIALPFLTISAGLAACGSDIDTRYGPPGGLRNAELPSATSTATTPPADDSGAPPPAADSGTMTASDSGADASAEAGMSGPCSVSFANTIYPKMQPAGEWQCSSGTCHGGTTSPVMDGASATNTYTALTTYMINALPYFNPASTALTGSSFDCNLRGTCGASQMPLTTNGATHASTADLTTVDTWIMCGAPNN